MTKEEFCKLYSELYGEEVDNLEQIKLHAFEGSELFDFAKLVNKNALSHGVSQHYTIEDIERCVEKWGLCKVEKEYIENLLNGA